MVEYTSRIDNIFASLADPIRRDIVERASQFELSVGDIASHYDVSLAAISKHIKILEVATLITKRKEGKKTMVTANKTSLMEAEDYLASYRDYHLNRFNTLENLLNERD